MSYSYDIENSVGKVRFLTGDTDSTDVLLTDEEIEYLLSTHTSISAASVQACYAISAKLSRESDLKVGDLSISKSQRSAAYAKLAKDLKEKASYALSGFAGGISESSKDSEESDSDRVVPDFTKGMMSSELQESEG